ncbi:uncharacterized protein EI90DRAFT_3117757 [Cantharellus anzutake]|uniref:uncharacterized protein n=1 Tax=Cantharellus anzutake TaxID=1750568 RepID=UPI00190382F3|nr:uncharacterized protein EI90DRAFT_3117757 [Cantharellus anzutake]KAF8339995.1 hypothetical protein EI90DRAFT_3117757 [Cantharellus anzutake]
MASSSKGKRSGVTAASFLDLKAELLKKKEELKIAKASGVTQVKGLTLKGIGAVKNTSKWDRPNRGVRARIVRDVEQERLSQPTLENARAALERKAKIYEKLKKGKTGGLTEKQYDQLLVDFDNVSGDEYESDSDDVDESATVPRPTMDDENDPVVEYEDEFGRVRTARRSEVPRHLARKSPEPDSSESDPHVIYGDQNYYPIYTPSEERVKEIEEKLAADTASPATHFDASRDNRARAAGFYQFSADEETRKQQMENLRKAREETQRKRAELGEYNEDDGEPSNPGTGSGDPLEKPILSGRGIQKRKRDIEERRKAIEAKRRKKDGGTTNDPPNAQLSAPVPPLPERNAADDFLANLEADLISRKG